MPITDSRTSYGQDKSKPSRPQKTTQGETQQIWILKSTLKSQGFYEGGTHIWIPISMPLPCPSQDASNHILVAKATPKPSFVKWVAKPSMEPVIHTLSTLQTKDSMDEQSAKRKIMRRKARLLLQLLHHRIHSSIVEKYFHKNNTAQNPNPLSTHVHAQDTSQESANSTCIEYG